jgi:hypothetical protein|tara:strand:- start:79 stop:549 length:471 start_codon:yes stop_codon:yes gene_type:complete
VLILLGLGVLWMAVLLPPIIRHRNGLARPVLTLVAAGRGSVRFDPTRLRSAGAAAAAVPVGAGSARRRRRDLLIALGGMAAFTFLAGVAVGGVVWMAHFLVDLVLVGYAVLVTQRHQLEVEREALVIPLRSSGSMLGGLGASVAMLDEAVLSRRAN